MLFRLPFWVSGPQGVFFVKFSFLQESSQTIQLAEKNYEFTTESHSGTKIYFVYLSPPTKNRLLNTLLTLYLCLKISNSFLHFFRVCLNQQAALFNLDHLKKLYFSIKSKGLTIQIFLLCFLHSKTRVQYLWKCENEFFSLFSSTVYEIECSTYSAI